MLNKKNKIVKTLYISAFVLLVLLFFSYLLPILGTIAQGNVQRKTALVNPKYANGVDEIRFYNPADSIYTLVLKKSDGYWFGEEENNVFPVDTKTIEAFISSLSKIRDLEIVSKDKSNWDKFALTKESGQVFAIDVCGAGNVYSSLYFGKMASYALYFRLASSETSFVYKMNNDIDSYLQVDMSFWTDPYLIPRYKISADVRSIMFSSEENSKEADKKLLAGNEAFDASSSLFELRRGLVKKSDLESYTLDSKLSVKLEDEKEIVLHFYRNDSIYIVQVDNDKYLYEISSWTFDKIKDLFKL